MVPPALLNSTVTIRRRSSQGTDALNNPIFGAPTSGVGWSTVYTNMPVRLAFNNKKLSFSPEGERISPNGTMYYNQQYTLKEEDRVLTSDGIEYVVSGIVPGYNMGAIPSHYECLLTLP